jgi:hypothetical protein
MIKVLDEDGLDELGIGDPQTGIAAVEKSCRIFSPYFDRDQVNSKIHSNFFSKSH